MANFIFKAVSGTFTHIFGSAGVHSPSPHLSPALNASQYIQQVLIGEIGDVVDRHKWLSFGLITAGVELLGTCLDTSNPVFTKGMSGDRFRTAIDQLFPAKYKAYNDLKNTKTFIYDLYAELRCGLNHSTLPKPKLALSERAHGQKHLETNSKGYLVLVAEDFYQDFKDACLKVIDMINKGKLSPKFSIKVI